jgi:hypothetical protein
MKTNSLVSADIDNSRCGGSAKSILLRPFGNVGIMQWMLFYRCFDVGVLLPVATFGSHQCTRFLSLSIPQGPKSRKAHDEIRKVFGEQVSSENRVCSSQSDIFCRLRCNNPSEKLNPVRDTWSIRRKDQWQMTTEQKTNAQCKQFILRMITARLERSLVGGNLVRVQDLQACQM